MAELNIAVKDTIHGDHGEFSVDPVSGRMTLGEKELAYIEDVNSKIADTLVDQMTEEQVEAIAETAIANAEATGDIAQQSWVNSQGFLKLVSTDGATITGDGTEESPLVAHSTMPTSVQNLLIENQLEVANRLVVDGSIVDVNGDQYPMAAETQYKLTAGDNITIDYTHPRQPIISASGGGESLYPVLVQKFFSATSVMYIWKGDTTSSVVAKSSSTGVASGAYDSDSDSTVYIFNVPAGINFYLGDDSPNKIFYSESVLSIPATEADLATKQDKLIAGENITIDGNTISATGGGSSSNVTYNRSTGTLTVDGVDVTDLNLANGTLNVNGVEAQGVIESFSGGLFQNFLQNEEGEDYILQKDVEAGYIKKTDLVVDSTPTEDSTNLVTSGGVYDALGVKDGYSYKTINLTDVKVGDNLSGATINFNPDNLPMFLNPNAGLSGFQWVVWSGSSGSGININVAWNANSIQDGSMNYIYNVPSGDLTIPNWLEDTYTFPENTTITDMYDLGGNRQNWDDVVVGMDPSGWNPTMATVSVRVPSVNVGDETKALNLVGTDIYINGQAIDDIPVEASESLVKSGGVWDDTHYKAELPVSQKTLYDIKVGDDMSNVTLTLPYLSVATGGLPTINFTNGIFIGFTDGATQVSWGIVGTGETSGLYEWAVSGHITKQSYTFGQGYVVESIENMNETANIPKLITYTPNAQIEIIDIGNLYNNKVDKYYDIIPGTKTFADLIVGDDLSGVKVTFPDPIDMTNLTGSSTNSQIVSFTNGYYINLSVNTAQTPAYFRLIDTNGQAAQNFYENSKTPTVSTYTFPDGFIISNINRDDINQHYGGTWQRQVIFDVQVEGEITIKWLFEQLTQNIVDLKSHVLHDADLYQSILSAARQEAQDIYDGTEVPLSSTGTTIIGTGGILDLGSSGQYVIPQNGGITITFSAVLALGNVQVYVNGTSVFDSSAISLLSVPPPTTIRVNGGDIITSSGSLGLLSSLNVTFYPNKQI